MQTEGVQRTLIVGLGEAGAPVVSSLLVRLAEMLGPVDVVAGIAVRAAEADEPASDLVLSIPPEGTFARWQADLEEMTVTALRRISHLAHLTALAGQGLSLRRADQVHLILVADMGEPWVAHSLLAVAGSLRSVVHHVLSCDAGLTGLLLLPAPDDAEQAQGDAPACARPSLQNAPLELPATVENGLPRDLFDRGCFLASPTNEAGLVIGADEDLTRLAAHFLALLASPLGATVAESLWECVAVGPTGASFGLAVVRWPGEALVDALSARRAQTVLDRFVAPVSGLGEKARVAAQSLVSGERLAPPFLIEELSALTPAPPDRLAEGVPDPPWPWQLADAKVRLEATTQRWEEDWCAAREPLDPTLSEMRAAWQAAASDWLERQVAGTTEGTLQCAQAHLAAIADLLEAFVEGLGTWLEEAEADLVTVERQTTPIARSLNAALASLPDSPLATLIRWGPWPLRWLRRWKECRQTQAAARRYAHLLRARLMALQALWSYEAALAFYRELATDWKEVVQAWDRWGKQVTRAAKSPALCTWQEKIEAAMAASCGPWTLTMVEELYRASGAVASDASSVVRVIAGESDVGRWVKENADAAEMERQLCARAADALSPLITMPVDLALARRWPDQEALADWLAAFVDQARPFFRFDETMLDEETRSQARLERWLFLPGTDRSPLARLCQTWPHPPALLQSQDTREIMAVTVRRGLPINLVCIHIPEGLSELSDGSDE